MKVCHSSFINTSENVAYSESFAPCHKLGQTVMKLSLARVETLNIKQRRAGLANGGTSERTGNRYDEDEKRNRENGGKGGGRKKLF